jgi:glycolate oxidase FAD binding subunit
LDIFEADSEDSVVEIIKRRQPLEIVGGGSKLGLGHPVKAAARLSLSKLSGVTLYEPAELVMSVRAATPLAEIEAMLAAEGQSLAFEPPDLSRLLGSNMPQTIGGIVATGLAGPRRCVAGGVRDHVLGLRAVNGRGEIFRAGGRVVKNVTGYDLCKLLTGSFGTMAVFTEITVKVLPVAETEESVVIHGLDAAQAVAAMSQSMGSSAGISGGAWLPQVSGESVTVLRLEGFGPSVEARRARLQLVLAGRGELSLWGAEQSRIWWRELRDVAPLCIAADQAVWKISLAASQAPGLVKKLGAIAGSRLFLDWAGSLLWLAVPCGADAQAARIRAMLPEGAHAMLVVAPEAVRAVTAIFQPLPAAQEAVENRVRQSFDPDHLLNPGRVTVKS